MRDERKEAKIEGSVVMSARIHIEDLAALDKFWETQGVQVKSMSQLISWSLAAMVDTLIDNNLVGERLSIVESHRHLTDRGLYQRSNLKRSKQKIASAVRWEEMRARGLDPKSEDPVGYKTIHENCKVDPYDNKHESSYMPEGFRKQYLSNFTNEEWAEIEAKVKADKEREIEETLKSAKGNENLLIAPKNEEATRSPEEGKK